MAEENWSHEADGQERAWRVWADLAGNGWILASFAYSKKEHAERHRDYLARRVDVKAWKSHEVREETPKAGYVVVDDVDALMAAAHTEDWT